MFFTECANLAERHPNLVSAIQKIDAQLRKMRTAEVIRVADLASFLSLDLNQVTAVLEGLAESGFLSAEDMVECSHCGMAVLRSDYDEVLEEEDEYRCTSCDRLWKDGRVRAVITYRRGDKWPELPPASALTADKSFPCGDIPSEEKNKPAPAQNHCRAITHDGVRGLDKKEYEKIIAVKKTYGIFIDGFTKEVSHKGKGRPKLTAAEFEIISEYIESKTAMRPFSTKTGRARSRDAAIKLLENARRKADVKLDRYKYLAFQLQKTTDPKMKTFLFAPPKDITYCLIIPTSV